MKKYILGLIFFCCMGLMATSCSEDDNISGYDVDEVRISAVFPNDISTGRGKTVDRHKLRCILELWTKGENAKMAHREEVALESAGGGTSLSFKFTVESGTYDCLMWADYIDVNAVATNNGNGSVFSYYADKYYDTSDLKNVTVKDVNSLINNEACDAFFYSGEIQKREDETFVQELNMLRPFTKVSFLEKNMKEFSLLEGLTVAYSTSVKFNVHTGKLLGKNMDVNYVDTNFNPEMVADGTLFSAYFFTGEKGGKLGEVKLGFTTSLGIQEVVIPQIIPLLSNQHIKVSGNMMAETPDPDNEFEINFDIEVEEWETSNQDIIIIGG